MKRNLEHDEQICNAATKEPWQARQIVGVAGPMQMPAANGWELLTEDGMPLADWFERKEDAVFAAEARTALPWYIGEVRRLREENARLIEALADKDAREQAKKALWPEATS